MTHSAVDLLKLLHGEYSSLHIGFNTVHACCYCNAQEYHDKYGDYGGGAKNQLVDWPSEEERLKAISENSVWTIQWYPNTPVGFNCVGASTFERAAEFALSFLEGS